MHSSYDGDGFLHGLRERGRGRGRETQSERERERETQSRATGSERQVNRGKPGMACLQIV